MTRRRLILAIVAAVLCGVAWWLSLDRLSVEERLLVGTWISEGRPGSRLARMRFDGDGRCAFGFAEPGGPVTMIYWAGPWSFRNGAVVFDGEASALRRGLRGLGLPSNPTVTQRLESITAKEMVLVRADGTREIWTRAPPE
jgi:hypothetical protein